MGCVLTEYRRAAVSYEKRSKKKNPQASFIAGAPYAARRSVIENVYKKVNGTLDGLDDKIGPVAVTETTTPAPTPAPSPVATPTPRR